MTSSEETQASIRREKMTGIIISIILILGGIGGPTGDFNEGTAVDQPVATSSATTDAPVKGKK